MGVASSPTDHTTRRRVRSKTDVDNPAKAKEEQEDVNGISTSGALFCGISARAIQCYLLLGARMIQQGNRNALAPLIVFMSHDFDIGTTQKGTLLSAIAAGYFFTQVPGGALADRLGAKNVITCAMMLSACCCMAVPTCMEHFGVTGLWVTMAIMGAVQGPLFPTSTVFLSQWMPRKTAHGTDEKAWGTSMLDIGISVGSLLIIPLANGLAGTLGWRGAYHAIGIGSLGYVALWQLFGAEEPNRCFFIPDAELRFLSELVPRAAKRQSEIEMTKKLNGADDNKLNGVKTAAASGSLTGLLGMPVHLLLHPGLWAIFTSHIAFNYGAYYLTNWSPTYYADILTMPPADAKFHLMMPHVTNLASKSLNPALVEILQGRGYSLLASRRWFTVVGFVASAAALLPVHQLRDYNPWVSTFLFSIANACFGLAPSGFKSNYLDVTERYVGVVSGYGNTLGTVASWVGPQLVAFLLQQFASWDVVLCSVAFSNCVAALVYMRYSIVTPVELDVDSSKKVELVAKG